MERVKEVAYPHMPQHQQHDLLADMRRRMNTAVVQDHVMDKEEYSARLRMMGIGFREKSAN